MSKREAPGLGEALRMLGVPRAQIRLGGIGKRRDIARKELHLLRQPALDDGVAPLEPQTQRFTVEDLFTHAPLDESAHLVGRGRPTPLRRPGHFKLAKVIARDLYSVAVECAGVFGMQCAVARKQKRPNDQELHQRFAPPALHRRARHRCSTS